MSDDRRPYSPPEATPAPTAETVARAFLKPNIHRWLWGAVWAFVLIPALFYLQFGEVGPLGWGATIFFAALCLLVAIGLHLHDRPEYRTRVALRNNWLDWVGAFWLVACAFGPLCGWTLTSVFTLTMDNWRWLYWGRVVLSIGLPVLTALSLLRYVRGRAALLQLALLLGVTALPVWSGWATLRDLWTGPVALAEYTHLPHTGRALTRP